MKASGICGTQGENEADFQTFERFCRIGEVSPHGVGGMYDGDVAFRVVYDGMRWRRLG